MLNISPQDLQNEYYDYSKVVVKKTWGYLNLIFSNEAVTTIRIPYLKTGAYEIQVEDYQDKIPRPSSTIGGDQAWVASLWKTCPHSRTVRPCRKTWQLS
jgi:hypothetical protein